MEPFDRRNGAQRSPVRTEYGALMGRCRGPSAAKRKRLI